MNGKDLIFGYSILSIIDLSNNANQPIVSNDKRYTLIFNGEIYNYRELRFKLIEAGYNFNTKSDTEFLLNVWQNWG